MIGWLIVFLVILAGDLVALWQLHVPGDIKFFSVYWWILVVWNMIGVFALFMDCRQFYF